MVFTTGFGTTSVTIFAYKHEGGESGFADNLSLTYIGPSNIQPIWADEFDGSVLLTQTGGALKKASFGIRKPSGTNPKMRFGKTVS